MRPVDKGKQPYTEIKTYAEALPHLETALGLYCSYCEFPISHTPHVEHISAKSKGGNLTDWSNFLLGCTYCNGRKGAKVTPADRDSYLWPDMDNTALAYRYDGGIPKVNVEALARVDPTGERLCKAQKLFALVNLGFVPAPEDKDRRFKQRNKAYELAKGSLEDWQIAKKSPLEAREIIKQLIVSAAQGSGFFSVWMGIFADEPDMLEAMLHGFPGTNYVYFDKAYHPKDI